MYSILGSAIQPDAQKVTDLTKAGSDVVLKFAGNYEGNPFDATVTLTPDGKMAYVAIAGSNWVAAIDIATMKQTAKIPVGYVPKRNATIVLP